MGAHRVAQHVYILIFSGNGIQGLLQEVGKLRRAVHDEMGDDPEERQGTARQFCCSLVRHLVFHAPQTLLVR